MKTATETRTMILDARRRLKLSQRDLALLSKTSPYAVNSAETGKNHVGLNALRRISQALNITLPELASAWPPPDGEWLSPTEASAITTLGSPRIRQLLRSGAIPDARQQPDGKWLIPASWARTRRPRPRGPLSGDPSPPQSSGHPDIRQARAIARHRRSLSIPIEVLAEDSGFTVERLTQAESAERPLTTPELRRLAPHLGGNPVALGANPDLLPPPGTIPLDQAARETGISASALSQLATRGTIPHHTGRDGHLYISTAYVAVASPATLESGTWWYTPSQHAVATGQSYDRIMQLVADGAYDTADAVIWDTDLSGPPTIRPDIEDLPLHRGRFYQHPNYPSPCRQLAAREETQSKVNHAVQTGDLQSAAALTTGMSDDVALNLLTVLVGRTPMLLHATARTLLRAEELLEAPTDARQRRHHRLERLSRHFLRCQNLDPALPDPRELTLCLEGETAITSTLRTAFQQHQRTFATDTLAQAANARRKPVPAPTGALK